MLIYGEFGTTDGFRVRGSSYKRQTFRVRGSSYKRRFYCSVIHILEIPPFMVDVSDLRGMEFGSLIVSSQSSTDGSGSASLDYGLWELCFSLVSPLWELCYSLASC